MSMTLTIAKPNTSKDITLATGLPNSWMDALKAFTTRLDGYNSYSGYINAREMLNILTDVLHDDDVMKTASDLDAGGGLLQITVRLAQQPLSADDFVVWG